MAIQWKPIKLDALAIKAIKEYSRKLKKHYKHKKLPSYSNTILFVFQNSREPSELEALDVAKRGWG